MGCGHSEAVESAEGSPDVVGIRRVLVHLSMNQGGRWCGGVKIEGLGWVAVEGEIAVLRITLRF